MRRCSVIADDERAAAHAALLVLVEDRLAVGGASASGRSARPPASRRSSGSPCSFARPAATTFWVRSRTISNDASFWSQKSSHSRRMRRAWSSAFSTTWRARASAALTTSVRCTIRSARARAWSRMSSPSRRTLARNSSRSFSSQRAARSSSGMRSRASSSSSTTSSRLIITDADSGIGRAPDTSVEHPAEELLGVGLGAAGRAWRGRAAPRAPARRRRRRRRRAVGHLAYFSLEPLGHRLGHHRADVAAEAGDVADVLRREERAGRRRRDEERVHAGDGQVHLRLGHLALGVGQCPQALDDEVGADLLGDVDDELGEVHHLDVVEVGERLADHLLALVEGEERLALLRVADGADDDLVEEERRRLDELAVPVVERVERPRIEHGGHRALWCSARSRRHDGDHRTAVGLRPRQPPARRRLDGTGRLAHRDGGVEAPEQVVPAVEGVGRVEQGEVEGRRSPGDGRGASPTTTVGPVGAEAAGRRGSARSASSAARSRSTKVRLRGAPRQRLDAEGAGAGEQVEDRGVLDVARAPRALKVASRTRSEVGRVVAPAGATSRRPPSSPATTRMPRERSGPPAMDAVRRRPHRPADVRNAINSETAAAAARRAARLRRRRRRQGGRRSPATSRRSAPAPTSRTCRALRPSGPLGPTRLQLSKPVIAAVEGWCVAGGLELACWCDLRVAGESARFGCLERRWGVPLIDGGHVPAAAHRRARARPRPHPHRARDRRRRGGGDRARRPGRARRHRARRRRRAGRATIAAFPWRCVVNDRRSVYDGLGLGLEDALANEDRLGRDTIFAAGFADGVARFTEPAEPAEVPGM